MRGVSRSSQNVGRKMRWTRQRTRRMRLSRTAKSWRPDTPTLVSSRRRCVASWPATEATKPGSPGRPRRKPLKPLRGECRTSPVRLWWTYSVCFFHLHPRLRAQRAPGIPCALSFRRDKVQQSLGRICVAGMLRCARSPSFRGAPWRELRCAVAHRRIHVSRRHRGAMDSGPVPLGASRNDEEQFEGLE
jgi:hypothetical protein